MLRSVSESEIAIQSVCARAYVAYSMVRDRIDGVQVVIHVPTLDERVKAVM